MKGRGLKEAASRPGPIAYCTLCQKLGLRSQVIAGCVTCHLRGPGRRLVDTYPST